MSETNAVKKSHVVTVSESLEIVGRHAGEFILQEARKERPESPLLLAAGSDTFGPYGPTECLAYKFVEDHPRPSPWTALLRDLCGNHRTPPGDVIGEIFFADKDRRANHKEWLIEVFGRQHVPFFMALAEKLSERFGVDVHVRLKSEEAKK